MLSDAATFLHCVQPYLQPLATVVVGFSALVIAGAQLWLAWQKQAHEERFARYKQRLDLFDRRYRIFKKVMEMLSLLQAEARADINELQQMLRDTAECSFLFGPEVEQFITEIYKQGVDLWGCNRTLNALGPDISYPGTREKAAAKLETLVLNFRGRSKQCVEIFERYLTFKDDSGAVPIPRTSPLQAELLRRPESPTSSP